ncbi:MAG: hypothetical protein NCW75_12635 [Phycisphaera sp.]|nr:MAG: hypothetical protein NCW75_12635 [Phycisphaera sp.]
MSTLVAGAALAQTVEFDHLRPSTTGIPGETMVTGGYGPDGRLWVSARWPFWGEGGVGVFDGTSWQTYANVNSPMPSQWVYDIAFDGDVAWLATEAGVVRFDGAEWTLFNQTRAPFPTNEARSIAVAPDGDVWVALSATGRVDGGVAHYDGDRWEVFTSASGLPWTFSDNISGIAVDASGNVWATHGSSTGIGSYDGTSWTLHSPTSFGRFDHPVADSTGRVWVASSNGVWMYEGGVWTRDLIGVNASTLSVGADDRVWAGTGGGDVYAYDGVWTPRTDIDDYVEAIAFDDGGRPLIIGRFTSHWLDGFEISPAYNGYNTGMTDFFVDNIHVDPNGHYWFSAGAGQLCEFDGTVWNGFNRFNQDAKPWPFATNPVTGSDSDDAGNLWVSTRRGLGRWDGVGWEVFDVDTSGIHDYFLEDVAVDSRGWVWVSSPTGASYFDGIDWTYSLQATPVGRLVTDDAGNVYACGRGGLRVFDGTSWSDSPAPLTSGHVHELAIDADGTQWIGTGDGLVQWDGVDGTIYDETNSDIPANNVTGVVIGHDGLIWVGARRTTPAPVYGGVASFDGMTWTRYMAYETPISHHQIEHLAVDAAGNILVSAYSEGVDVILVGGSCRADLDGDGALTIFDFLAFQNQFDAGDPSADFDGDGELTIFDFLAFQNEFDAGCE